MLLGAAASRVLVLGPGASSVVTTVFTLGPLVVCALIAIRVATDDGFGRRVLLTWRWTDVALGLVVALVVRAVHEIIVPTTGGLVGGFGAPLIYVVVLIVLTAAVVSPVVEELFFRGVVLAALRSALTRLGPRWSAVIAVTVSTGVFVAAHVVVSPAGPVGVVAPLLVGVGAGILFCVTGRTSAGVVAHVGVNASGIVLLLV